MIALTTCAPASSDDGRHIGLARTTLKSKASVRVKMAISYSKDDILYCGCFLMLLIGSNFFDPIIILTTLWRKNQDKKCMHCNVRLTQCISLTQCAAVITCCEDTRVAPHNTATAWPWSSRWTSPCCQEGDCREDIFPWCGIKPSSVACTPQIHWASWREKDT